MADLVVGLSKTAVQVLADKVKAAIKEEAEQWKTVQRDLVFITGEFEMMQSFLDTATEEHVKNRIVRTWVRQVRDLSHDVEDNIDFVLHLDPTKKSWWLRLLPSCSWAGFEVPPPLVDEAVAETTLLRARVVDVSQRNIRYNLIVDSASNPMPASTDLDPVQKMAESSFDILINAVKKSGPVDLAGLINRSDTDLHVVSVCGTEGDLVKVAIVRNMYSDARIHKEFQCRAWVKLVHPFNPHNFIQSLVTQFFRHSSQEQGEVNVCLHVLERIQQATQGDLIKDFVQKESNHRFLIVLEDLSTMVQWDDIRSYLPDRKNGSRIVVLTHHPVVASQCTGQPCRVAELQQISPVHSVRVYYKEGFQHDKVLSFMKREPYHSLVKYGLVGRDSELNGLFEKAQKSHENRRISVWGMPGVGKSALVDALYHKLMTINQFNRHAWVNVSHPFNPTEFCHSLLESLHRESTSKEGKYQKALRAEDLINMCRNRLSEHVCLFVIDGVQSNEDWDWINSNLILYGDSRSCIIIITSEESVAKHCAASIDGVYNVKGLHDNAAIQLFEKALEEKGWFLKLAGDRQDKEETKNFFSRCGGLPRVLITMARYMASKPKDVFRQEKRRLSDNFLHELMINPEFDSLRDIQPWMHSYLHACPPHLKKFMLYLSIFPQDTIIRRRRLIRRWIAEGYSKGTDSNSLEKYAEKIFDEVATLSIMQPVLLEATKVVGYQVNGFFREYIMSRQVEETIFFPVEVSSFEKRGQSHLTTEGIGQHLAIGSTWHWDGDQILFESLDFSRLRSLTVFNSFFYRFYVSDRMRVLRVLDLENTSRVNDNDFEVIGKLPSRLKFLSLRGNSLITRLPDSVGDLLQLQTLDIRGTSIVKLPPFITNLRKLQHIRAGTTAAWTDNLEEGSMPPSSSSWSSTLGSCLPNKFLRRGGPAVGSRCIGVKVPRGINRLEALLTLGVVHVNNTAEGEAILDEIVFSLPQLKKLKVCGELRGSALYNIDGSTHLESLSVQFERDNNSIPWNQIDIPRSLRSLKMIGDVGQLSLHMLGLAVNLGKLTLEMTNTMLKAGVIQELRRLPNLLTLRLRARKDQQDGELKIPNAIFSKLQVLEIASKSKLHVMFDEGAVEKLEQLKVHCLEGSEMQFSGLEHPISLKQVWLLGSFEDALKEAVQQQLDKHPKNPAPKLELQPLSSEVSRS